MWACSSSFSFSGSHSLCLTQQTSVPCLTTQFSGISQLCFQLLECLAPLENLISNCCLDSNSALLRRSDSHNSQTNLTCGVSGSCSGRSTPSAGCPTPGSRWGTWWSTWRRVTRWRLPRVAPPRSTPSWRTWVRWLRVMTDLMTSWHCRLGTSNLTRDRVLAVLETVWRSSVCRTLSEWTGLLPGNIPPLQSCHTGQYLLVKWIQRQAISTIIQQSSK